MELWSDGCHYVAAGSATEARALAIARMGDELDVRDLDRWTKVPSAKRVTFMGFTKSAAQWCEGGARYVWLLIDEPDIDDAMLAVERVPLVVAPPSGRAPPPVSGTVRIAGVEDSDLLVSNGRRALK